MSTHPTIDEIRNALVARVEAYCKRTKITPRMLCQRAIHDPNFFNKLNDNANFTLKTYDKLHRYMDEHAAQPSLPKSGTRSAKPQRTKRRAATQRHHPKRGGVQRRRRSLQNGEGQSKEVAIE